MSNQCVSSPTAYAPSETAGATSAKPVAREAAGAALMEGLVMATVERTKEELMSEVRYGIVFASMNEDWNCRLRKAFNLLTYAAAGFSGVGAMALIGKLGGSDFATWWTAGWALLSVLSAAITKAYHFDKREAEFRKAKAEFESLEGKGWSLHHSDLQRQLGKLRAAAPNGGQWLAPLAYNKACTELGYPDVKMRVSCFANVLGHGL